MGAISGDVKAASRILDAGCAVNVAQASQIPLHISIRHGTPEVAKLLLEGNASANAKNNHGETPLTYATSLMASIGKQSRGMKASRPHGLTDEEYQKSCKAIIELLYNHGGCLRVTNKL